MLLMRCDFHTRFQQIAMVDSVTGKILNRRLDHGTGEAQQFYAALPAPARIGMEATGRTNWFERMLADQGNELWVGDEAQIRAGGGPETKDRSPITVTRCCTAHRAWPWQQSPSRNRQKTRQSSGLAVGVASESRRTKTV